MQMIIKRVAMRKTIVMAMLLAFVAATAIGWMGARGDGGPWPTPTFPPPPTYTPLPTWTPIPSATATVTPMVEAKALTQPPTYAIATEPPSGGRLGYLCIPFAIGVVLVAASALVILLSRRFSS